MAKAEVMAAPAARAAWRDPGMRYLGALAALAAVTGGLKALPLTVNPADAGLSYLLVVLAAATAGDVWLGAWASGVAVLALNYFFLPPVGTLTIADPANWFAFTAFLATALVSSQLVARARARTAQAEAREAASRALLSLSEEVLASPPRDREPWDVEAQLERLAGQCSRALGGGPCLIRAVGSIASLALDRLWWVREVAQAEALRQSEAVKSALLSSVSHELRTPLAAIRLAATALQQPEVWQDAAARQELLEALDEEAERLNQRVGNLLAMSRVEAGALRLRRQRYEPAEVVGAALRHLGRGAGEGRLTVHLAEDLPMVWVDLGLVQVALANLLDNALKYSPSALAVELWVEAIPGRSTVRFRVADRGPGVPPGERDRIFERFYRSLPAGAGRPSGTGLGLSIARALVQAHGGTVRHLPRPGGGSLFDLELPADAAPSAPLAGVDSCPEGVPS